MFLQLSTIIFLNHFLLELLEQLYFVHVNFIWSRINHIMNDIFKNPHDTCKSFLFYNTEKKYQKKNL